MFVSKRWKTTLGAVLALGLGRLASQLLHRRTERRLQADLGGGAAGSAAGGHALKFSIEGVRRLAALTGQAPEPIDPRHGRSRSASSEMSSVPVSLSKPPGSLVMRCPSSATRIASILR